MIMVVLQMEEEGLLGEEQIIHLRQSLVEVHRVEVGHRGVVEEGVLEGSLLVEDLGQGGIELILHLVVVL
jgi:hypothetical protein